jgi:hypothetical protein
LVGCEEGEGGEDAIISIATILLFKSYLTNLFLFLLHNHPNPD